MKRKFTVVLTVILAMLFAVEGFAVSRGKAYIEDNGYFDEEIKTPAPGDTVYIALVKKSDEEDDYEIDSDDKPSKAELKKVEVIGISDDEEYDLIENGKLSIVTEDADDGIEWYFAKLEIDDIDLDDYPDDGFLVSGTLKVTRKSGKTFEIDLEKTFDGINFTDAEKNSELKKTAQLYRFKSNKDIKLEFPNEKGWFEGKTKKAINVFAAMSHSKIRAIQKKNDDAELVFYIGNGAEFEDIRNGKIVIEADDDAYLYEIDSGKLKNRTSWYDDDEEAFIIETDVLGSYVVSDEKLSTSYDYDDDDDNEDEDDDEDDDDYEYVYDEDEEDEDDDYFDRNYTSVVITNPVTGVEE